MKPHDLRRLITSVLKFADPTIPFSKSAVELLMLTAATETMLGEFLYQQSGGPARGIFQMELETEMALWRYIYRKASIRSMLDLKFDYCYPLYQTRSMGDLVYQILMARIYYWRVPEALPNYKDVPELSRYWKQYWNTRFGKGTAVGARAAYKMYVEGRV